MFDDAQLASIKRRLNLTADQEQMWPAVAVALRNIGVEREREARARGVAGEINPDSAASSGSEVGRDSADHELLG